MFPINNLTLSASQTTGVQLADGTTVTLAFYYRPAVQRWTFDVTYKSFIAKGLGLSTHPNLLRDWRAIIPFGLQVVTADGTDPFMASDLSYNQGTPPRVVVNILDGTNGGTDVEDVETQYFAAPSPIT